MPESAPPVAAPGRLRAHRLLERVVAGVPEDDSPVTHVELLAGRSPGHADWPSWVPDDVRDRFVDAGVARPWPHQVRAADLLHEGRSVVIATGTGSGKSLAYQLPALSNADPRSRVLYLAPTKALAVDQLGALTRLGMPGLRAATYDGDTAREQRDWVRGNATWILSNPDMLHRGILPQHARWSSFLRHLELVVIDEAHAYRGVFGAHVSGVLRRLRRVCAGYGAGPRFALASATSSDPAAAAERLVGLPVEVVDEDSAPRGRTLFVLWEPPLEPGGPTSAQGTSPVPQAGPSEDATTPRRRSAGSEAARVLADLVVEGARTLAFVRSRRGAETTALAARRHLDAAGAHELAGRVEAYRGGYLAEERRDLEARLSDGRLLGLATTNALELGVDISGLDAVVLAGFPGRLASLWQQAGRAGRAGAEALVVLIARDDPLDTYLVHHPEAVFGRPIEASVFDPANPYVLADQLCCAAAELPLRESELELFGGAPARVLLDQLTEHGVLRRRPSGWYWTHHRRPDVDLRGAGGPPYAVVDGPTGTLLGTVDAGSAYSTVHAGAVYLHRGTGYVVDRLELETRTAVVHGEEPDWSTTARTDTDIEIVHEARARDVGPVAIRFGTVRVSRQVISYQRRLIATGQLIDETPLDFPTDVLDTKSVWYTLSDDAVDAFGFDPMSLAGALHAAEHAAIGLLPLFATCDRWDVGGVSTALHPDTGRASVFVYDGHPGGAGFAERGFEVLGTWLGATRDAIAACECSSGCPSCVQSPKCGNGNEPLSKPGALTVLDLVLTHLGAEASRP